MKDLKLLLVDDHRVVRDGIKYTLQLQDKFRLSIHEAENGQEAVEKAKHFKYDLIIMDINMPVLNGIEATKNIMDHDKEAKILGLSMFDEDFHILQMIKAGARGYILKNSGSEELVNAINTILRGKKYYSNEVALKIMEPYHDDIVERKPRPRSKSGGILTKRETQILKMIGNEFTNEEISKKLNLSKRTVDTHRQNIINKLQVKNTAGLIKYAIRNNYI